MTAVQPAPSSDAEVVVIGDALLDVVAQPSGTARHGTDVPATIRIGAGGQGANLAVRLARGGVDVDLVCALGPDPAGALVRDALAAAGVRVSAVATEATGTVVILLDAAGERSMLSQRAPFASDVLAALPTTASAPAWLIVSGYLLLEAGAERLAAALATHSARRALVGCTVPEPAAAAWALAAQALRPDLIILNRDELAAIGVAAAGSNIVVTEADGATASIAGVSAAVQSENVPRPTDTTGAGDAFAATLVASLLRAPWPPAQSILLSALTDASSVAWRVARVPGAQGPVHGERHAASTP